MFLFSTQILAQGYRQSVSSSFLKDENKERKSQIPERSRINTDSTPFTKNIVTLR